jgi:hypothetical protein
MPNEGLTKRDDRDGYKAPYETPYKMLHSYAKPEFDSEGKKISYKAPLHHLRRFGCAVLDATSVDSFPRHRGLTRSLELDQKHA